ncbi:bifunctional 4-hydroxy-2-oxoglutarate aldolase/2-dehydro-3-deoxy-phosphogluconate aldolase (plasmid) [Priestia megaterium]|uniref:bifunctional 4-hydroxy-2-oxoglutarate aldolase/2-dehydro-3-deoxy-phosphogluconate aldolase n=1 Tax=Priestia megaterium TaxID=1404 RepID=UPI003899E612
MDKGNIKELISEHKVIAIIRDIHEQKIIQTVESLLEGGINLVEVTLNHVSLNAVEETTKKIHMINEQFKGDVCVGAGTVLTSDQVISTVQAGAEFIISPNVEESVIKKTNELGKVSIPGALTPSDMVTAYNLGADFVKLFPAGELGLNYVKAVMAPLRHIPVIAVGGITPENIPPLIELGIRGIGVGGNLIQQKAIQENQFEHITNLAKRYKNSI